MSPGESGNPLSPHYGDLLRRWRDFGWMTIARAKPAHSLRLVPK
jgi:acyl-homoserine lactone acylase PvdQ